jgi:type 1 glutamine amidotransferase
LAIAGKEVTLAFSTFYGDIPAAMPLCPHLPYPELSGVAYKRSRLLLSWLPLLSMLWLGSNAVGQTSPPSITKNAGFKVLAIADAGGHHIAFTKAARPWLLKCGELKGFSVDFVTNMAPVTTSFLADYRVVLQLDFPPYGWPDEAQSAFKSYIEQGRGGWVGLHHAALLGDFDGYAMWPWFSNFMGGIRFKSYIPTFVAGTVHVEDKLHPCMKGLPESFVISREEWYTFDHSPRAKVHVLASVDESSYAPDSPIRMGDHPVVWTNEQMSARNIYIFMGHGPDLLDNEAFTTLLGNAIIWAAGK